MNPRIVVHLTRAFIRIYLRDRQAIFFGLIFPIVLLSAFGFTENREQDPIKIGIIDEAANTLSVEIVSRLQGDPKFLVEVGDSVTLENAVRDGDKALVIRIPRSVGQAETTDLAVIVNAEEVRSLGFVLPLLEQSLVDVERGIRGTRPLFNINVQDVDTRGVRYLDFVLPGILAFALMQISIAGSAYNLVEYRRKGILKRLFVTPLRPGDFILSIGIARMVFCMIQLTAVILFARFVLDINIAGNLAELLIIVALGVMVFLCLGFTLGSVAETQQAIGGMGSLATFPQIILSGVFFPIDQMPEMVQPVASLLPLSFIVSAMREITANGASLLELLPDLAGIVTWLVILFLLASRLFSWKKVAS